MLVLIQAVLPVCGDVEVFPAVVVIVAHTDALAPACGRQARLRGYIAEGSVMIIAVKMVARTLSRGKPFEGCSIHEEDVRPSVVVVIKDGDTCAGGFNDVFLGLHAAEDIRTDQAGFFGYVQEIS